MDSEEKKTDFRQRMPRFLRLLFYADVSKEELQKIKEAVYEDNRKTAIIMNAVLSVTMIPLFVLAVIFADLRANMWCYGFATIVTIICWIMILQSRECPKIISAEIWFFESGVLIVGLINSASGNNYMTLMFLVMMMICAMAFIDPPYRLITLIIVCDLIYFLMIWPMKQDEIQIVDSLDVFIYSDMAIFFTSYLRGVKYKNYFHMLDQEELAAVRYDYAYKDSMTECFNTRAYREKIAELESDIPEILNLVMVDVNSLKENNDRWGHEAGDEMIQSIAKALKVTFEAEGGACYRIGGDEFIVIDETLAPEKLENLCNEFALRAKALGQLSNIELSASIGVACRSLHPECDVKELRRLADMEMYRSKEAYYEESGHERRK